MHANLNNKKLTELENKRKILLEVYENINKEQMILNATLNDYDTPEEIALAQSEAESEKKMKEEIKSEPINHSDIFGVIVDNTLSLCSVVVDRSFIENLRDIVRDRVSRLLLLLSLLLLILL